MDILVRMVTDKKEYGVNGSFIFGDCATIPNPTSEQLADIAEESAESCRTFLEAEPCISMLSYSTKGSAKGDLIDKVTAAVAMLHGREPWKVLWPKRCMLYGRRNRTT